VGNGRGRMKEKGGRRKKIGGALPAAWRAQAKTQPLGGEERPERFLWGQLGCRKDQSEKPGTEIMALSKKGLQKGTGRSD